MIQMGSFPQLSSILDAVQIANPMEDEDDENEEDFDDSDVMIDADRLLGLPGIPGESRVKMLSDDILKQVEALRSEGTPLNQKEDTEDDSDDQELDAETEASAEEDEELDLPVEPPVSRQTFVFSATLTLPSVNTTKPGKKRRHDVSVGGAISDILDKSHAKGKTKVVDLSTNTKGNELIEKTEKKSKKEKNKGKSTGTPQFQLPPGLELQQVKCTQKHKDSYLYAYLMTTSEGNSGPCLIFCNSIACVRRVGRMLQTLGLDVRILHAQMQQVRVKIEVVVLGRLAVRKAICTRPDPSK